ncbi:MAG: heme o synthase [Planctomycetota bacterium]
MSHGAVSTLRPSQHVVLDYLDLGKLKLSSLVLVTVGAGSLLASAGSPPLWPLVGVLLGVGLCSMGSAALNMYLECDYDSKMDRTKDRPLPAGRLGADQALGFAAAAVSIGLLLLLVLAGWLAASLTVLSIVIYVLVYTPLKRRSSLNTLVGAVAGALPPVIGWAAVAGELSTGAWILFAVLFVWQLPHSLAIAWLHRDDYGRAGIRMLSVEDGDLTIRQIFLFSLTLLPVSLLPVSSGLGGTFYFYGAIALGLTFLAASLLLFLKRAPADARRVFLFSLFHLPMLLALWLTDTILLAS